MSLFDTYAGSLDRGLPHPNHLDRLNDGSIKAHQTISTTYKTDASVANTRVTMQNGAILFFDSNNRLVLSMKNGLTTWYDDLNRVIKVDGVIPALANYPVTIEAIYGYDVYTDILGISAP